MISGIFDVTGNAEIAKNVMKMTLFGDTSAITAPGQFVNIKVDGFYLRRPISVCDKQGDVLTIIYKIVGGGTAAMAQMKAGDRLDVLSGLGNGYDLEPSGDRPCLIGGGAGVPPLYLLCRKLVALGKSPSVILGFNAKDEVFYENEFKRLTPNVTVATADGSYGEKGFVTDVLEKDSTYAYVCGPEPMLKAVCEKIDTSGQFSFEERMGCGFGACMGCTCKTKYGAKRICKDGPVLKKEEIIW